jgi:hypothetical protein
MKPALLRLSTGLFLVITALAAGAMVRTAWLILPLALIYTIAFILGRWKSWQASLNTDLLARVLSNVLSTLAVQTLLVALLFLIGRGAASVLNRSKSSPFSEWDIFYCLVTAIIGIGLGGIVAWRERNQSPNLFPHNEHDQSNTTTPSQPHEIKVLPNSLTPENFYRSIHYSHGTYEEPTGTFISTPNAKSAGSNQKIASAEQALGVTLPEGLKVLYRIQNGGSLGNLCTVKPGIMEPHWHEQLVIPFGGYDDLLPTEGLRTLFDAVTDYADPDDENQAESFPAGCKRMIILAQWYRHTLFLDYNAAGEPKVGFVDFDHSDQWQNHCVWWNDFDLFFRELRNYESL